MKPEYLEYREYLEYFVMQACALHPDHGFQVNPYVHKKYNLEAIRLADLKLLKCRRIKSSYHLYSLTEEGRKYFIEKHSEKYLKLLKRINNGNAKRIERMEGYKMTPQNALLLGIAKKDMEFIDQEIKRVEAKQ